MLSFEQLSFWEKETYLHQIDCLIVGSGIVGISTAIHLKKMHPTKKVCVLERGYLPSGASTKNAGFACIGSASELLDDLNHTDESTVFETVAKRWKGLHYLRELIGDQYLEYKKHSSHELFTHTEKKVYENCLNRMDYLNENLKQITGIESVYKDAPAICDKFRFKGFSAAISNEAEGQLDTGKMMHSMHQLAASLGIILLNGIAVESIEDHFVTTPFGKIQYDKLAICTNGLSNSFFPDLDLTPARAQVIITSPISNLPFKGIFHFDKGYYYFRNVGDRVLFGGGRNQDFESEETDELNTSDQIINHLTAFLESQILPNSAFTIEHHWAGIMGVGKQKSPIVKQLRDNQFCAVRLGGMGVAIGSLVGKELAELME